MSIDWEGIGLIALIIFGLFAIIALAGDDADGNESMP